MGQAQQKPATGAPQQWQSAGPTTPFERGLAALKLDEHARAIEEFTLALKTSTRPEVWFNLGLAHSKLHHTQQTAHAYRNYLHRADPVHDAAGLPTVAAELDRLRRTSTVLVLAVTPVPSQVLVDGLAVTVDDNSLWLTPGIHSLALAAPGHHTHEQTVELPAGRFQFALQLRTTPAEVHGAPLPRETQASTAPPPRSRPGEPNSPALAPQPKSSHGANSLCLLGDTCIGLVATGGLPNAAGVGISLRMGDYLGIGLDTQILPKIKVDSAEVSAKLFTASIHLHPLKNALFASLGLGLQQVEASLDHPAASVQADWNIPVLSLGFGLISRSGFTLGTDLAIFVELQNSDLKLETVDLGPDLVLEPALQERLESEANAAVDSVRSVLPVMFQLNVLRVGYQF